MEKSSHRNFVEWYKRNRDALISNEILPYQDAIFDLFNVKFKFDAKKDWEKWRVKLEELWLKCANKCKEIHETLQWNNDFFYEYDDTMEMVNNIVNMDYWTLQNFFDTLKDKYKQNTQVYKLLSEISDCVWEMRKISKKYTNIIYN